MTSDVDKVLEKIKILKKRIQLHEIEPQLLREEVLRLRTHLEERLCSLDEAAVESEKNNE